jgi:nucleoside-diphosphate-sugar epimerase
MKVLITGSTGMVGKAVCLECLEDPLISEIVLINRSSCGIENPKIREIIHQDFFDLSSVQSEFSNMDACFFCMGVSVAGMSEEEYRKITYDLTLYFAQVFISVSPKAIFTYVSGEYTDSTETGRVMWARVKGKTENAIMAMEFTKAYLLRPGYIHPMKGIRSRTKLYAILYDVLGIFFPIIKWISPHKVTTSVNVGLAHIELLNGCNKRILHAVEINELAERNHLRRARKS